VKLSHELDRLATLPADFLKEKGEKKKNTIMDHDNDFNEIQ